MQIIIPEKVGKSAVWQQLILELGNSIWRRRNSSMLYYVNPSSSANTGAVSSRVGSGCPGSVLLI